MFTRSIFGIKGTYDKRDKHCLKESVSIIEYSYIYYLPRYKLSTMTKEQFETERRCHAKYWQYEIANYGRLIDR